RHEPQPGGEPEARSGGRRGRGGRRPRGFVGGIHKLAPGLKPAGQPLIEYRKDWIRLHNLEESQLARPRRAFLVGIILPGQPGYVVEEHLDELAQLAETARAEVVGRAVQARKAPDRATFIGSGK